MRCLLSGVFVLMVSYSVHFPRAFAEDNLPPRIAHQEKSHASIEREEAVAAKEDARSRNARANALLAEVRRNIALTIADLRDDRPSPNNARPPGRPAHAHADVVHDRRHGRGETDHPHPPHFGQAHHLHVAARHLDAAGYESMAKKARGEADRLMREARYANVPGHRPHADIPPHVERVGRAIGELRREVDQLRKDMDALERHVRGIHPRKHAGRPSDAPALPQDFDVLAREMLVRFGDSARSRNDQDWAKMKAMIRKGDHVRKNLDQIGEAIRRFQAAKSSDTARKHLEGDEQRRVVEKKKEDQTRKAKEAAARQQKEAEKKRREIKRKKRKKELEKKRKLERKRREKELEKKREEQR